MDLKNVHQKLLELVIEFDEICSKNQIKYTLHGGSLLGAIREKGFIPWDDDIDVAMTRNEYIKFEKILKNSHKYYVYGSIKKQFRKKNDDSFWVDIFICDYIDEGLLGKVKNNMLTVLDIMNRDKNSIKLSNFSQYGKKKQIAFRLIYNLGKIFSERKKVSWYEKISEKKFLGNRTLMHRSNDQYKGRNEIFPAEWMDEFIRVPFEDTSLLIMKEYHKMLVKCYGENYMVPIKDTRNSDVHELVRKDGGLKL